MRVIRKFFILALVSSLSATTFLVQWVYAQEDTTDEQSGEQQEANNDGAIQEKQDELKSVEDKIKKLKEARLKKQSENSSLTTALEVIDDNLTETRLELDKTALSIDQVRLEMRKNLARLQEATIKLGRLHDEMLSIIRTMSAYETKSLWQTLLEKGSFTDYLQTEGAYRSMQNRMTNLLVVTQDARKVEEEQRKQLLEKEEELAQLRGMQEAQKNALKVEEGRKKDLLTKNVQQQKQIKADLAEAEQARQEIQQQIFTLRNAGINMSLTDAVKIAQYAGKLTGVRPALLLGVLKVESNLGNNVGSGRYPDDVHPAHREAFVRVVQKLGLNIATAPVSAKPKSYSGWGGAMGPGQIMPGIWESVEGEVARLTGKALPSPYELQDAFVATAIILRNSGAAAGSEYEAVNRYFAGSNWQRFTWYGDRVLAVAKEYEGK